MRDALPLGQTVLEAGTDSAGGRVIFDICGPLPTGFTVLEASAGTGKTFTIAALAARYVAAGIPLENILVVTFTRMATGELRERVRERLVTAEAGLHLALAGVVPPEHDLVLRLLADGTPEELETRRALMARALADFDAATIATTHGFCQHILSGLGTAGDVEYDVAFVEDAADLVDEVVDDLYVRHVLAHGYPGFDRKEAGAIATHAVANPTAPLQPKHAPRGSTWAKRVALAKAVRQQLERRKLRARVITYDDLLTRLEHTLEDPVRGPVACQRLQERYQVALVDEFQDTDPVQWGILKKAFGTGSTTLVLIGDPKQAIYSFRGADVFAYLRAAKTATATATLDTNWRSDQGLIDGCGALFGNAQLGHPDILFRTVRAPTSHREPGLVGAPIGAPLRIRMLHRADGAVLLTDKGFAGKSAAEAVIAADLAEDLVGLLEAGAQLVTRGDRGDETGRRDLRAGHVAVLVRTNRQAATVRDALDRRGVPAVINGAGSVFGTPVARDWLRLLEALERPASPSRARAAALTTLVGWSADDLASAGEATVEALQADLFHWATVLERRGVASLLELMTRSGRIAARLLSGADGEREVTDLRHVGQLLHAEATAEGLGTTALASWLRRRIAEADTDTAAEERSRRLDSDAEAVQVLTIHRSKGLEFPVVYVPFLWGKSAGDDTFPVYHDPASDDERTVDVGGHGGPDHQRHLTWRMDEARGEDLRLAYVALTRARHQVILWWTGSWGSRLSPLGRLLFGRAADGAIVTELKPVPSDEAAATTLEQLAVAAGGVIAVERVGAGPDSHWNRGPDSGGRLDVRRFERTIDSSWRRTSYTAITSGAHEPTVASEPETVELGDEELPPAPIGAGEAPPGPIHPATAGDAGQSPDTSQPSPWEDIPRGPQTGILVHAVLETADFAAADLPTEMAARVDEQVSRRGAGTVDRGSLSAALFAAVTTPLGPLVDGISLSDVAPADRLDELGFELPLAGGEKPRADVGVATLASFLQARLPSHDPLAGYSALLDDPALDQQLRGYLTGSIDLVLRLRGESERFVIVDYKTNWLAPEGEPLTAWHYRPATLLDAMQRAHYPLQALLYSVALHRYLRWRLPSYDPDRNLAGVLYLFVRGMTGPAVPRVGDHPCGVFSWRAPAGVIAGLSDLLDGQGGPP